LDGEHSVIVKAEYEGAVYEAVLFIQIKKRVGENNYLGTVETLTLNNPNVTIAKGNPNNGNQTAIQGNYVLAVAGGTVGANTWKAGFVYQWTGFSWEERAADKYTDLYTSCFKDGLNTPGLANNTEWFAAIIVKQLIAMKAFVEEFESVFVLLKKGGVIQSESTDPTTGEPLFKLEANGFLKAVEAVFKNITILGDSFFQGDILSGPLELNSRNPSNITNISLFATGTSAKDLHQYLQSLDVKSPVDGTYGGTPFVYFRLINDSGGRLLCGLYDKDMQKINIPGGTIVPGGDITGPKNCFMIRSNSTTYYNLSYVVQIGFYNPQGKTFKLNNLPYNEPTMSGEIWRDGSGYLRIKI